MRTVGELEEVLSFKKYIDSFSFPVMLVNSRCDVLLLNDIARERFNHVHGKCYTVAHGFDRPCWEVLGRNACPIKRLARGEEGCSIREDKILIGGSLGNGLYLEMVLDGGIAETLVNLKDLAERDSLTGLYNRRKMAEILDFELKKVKRYGCDLSVIFLDMDNFKVINDTFGHSAGDLVLRKVGSIVQENIRETDVACRYGGEEFLVILPETDAEGAYKVAEKIRKAVGRICVDSFGLSLSAGVTQATKEDTLNTLIERADRAMYMAKKAGKNRTCLL